jgi:two-component sensor histidine kinase
MGDENVSDVNKLLDTPQLAEALESDRFRQFLDHLPIAIAVSELLPSETITYANLEFERITGLPAHSIEGRSWKTLPGLATAAGDDRLLREAVKDDDEYIGRFTIDRGDDQTEVDAWSNTIEDEGGTPKFRLVALAVLDKARDAGGDAAHKLHEKDVLLLELQHRVKNNLQMITALIRLESRNATDGETGERFGRLEGRINALATLYTSLSGDSHGDTVDLGVYLSQIASDVIKSQAKEGIRLDLKVDTWPVSVNVAMPTGLVVNELLINALKYAFVGRDGGTITLHSLLDDDGCRVIVADDGIGLPEGVTWPTPGKLGAVIAQSLRQNAKASIKVESNPDSGVRVTIFFAKKDAASAPGS